MREGPGGDGVRKYLDMHLSDGDKSSRVVLAVSAS